MGRSFTKLAVLSLLLLLLYSCRSQKINASYDPVRIDTGKYDKAFLYPAYRDSQILVFFKKPPTPEQKRIIKAKIHGPRVDTAHIKIRPCNCNEYIEQWTATNIQTVIHGEGVRSGSTSGSKGVGEDSLAYYSLNYILDLPRDTIDDQKQPYTLPPTLPRRGKDVVIAVLDTGIDTAFYKLGSYLWTNRGVTSDKKSCYIGDLHGWNFADNNRNIFDDHRDHHGTIVSGYITREFENANNNFPQLMVLKTHRSDGSGDLFGSICAIHYAIDHGANIINASWGFYSYLDTLDRPYVHSPHPYMDSLLSQILRSKGILFVAASGNKIKAVDDAAHEIYRRSHNGVDIPNSKLRDLYYHNFYPACVSSKDNNVIAVVTTNERITSPTQNHSNLFVDLAVRYNRPDRGFFKFYLPYPPTTGALISGSSYATAIATGKIGAYLPTSIYRTGISKTTVISRLFSIGGPGTIPHFIDSSSSLRSELFVRDGVYLFPARR